MLYNYVKNNKIWGMVYMKPRIFISSTFYDLKYIREDLANFVKSYDYEPILFEDGDIGYVPGNNLDVSCYESMKNSDMVILIVGGEYGSAASGEKKDEFIEYMSVTRNEFRAAIDSGIPVFVMIDKKVMTEYGVYEANYDLIEKKKNELKFASTKNVNVFRFIKEIKSIVTIPIQEFEKSADIKGFISKQWADMFKSYLASLRSDREDKKIENSVNEMKQLIQKMNIMLDSVGKNVLSKENPKEYENVVNQQEIVSFCNSILGLISLNLKDSYKIESSDERKRIICSFFNALREIEHNDIVVIDEDRIGTVLNIFDKYGFSVAQISSDISIISKKIDLLSDRKNMEEVIEIMSKDEYFNKLIRN